MIVTCRPTISYPYPRPVLAYHGFAVRYALPGNDWEKTLHRPEELCVWMMEPVQLRNWCIINIHNQED